MSKILLVDGHSSFRQAFALVLNDEPDLEVIAQAGTPNETHEVLDGCDLVIIEPVLPDGDGLELISELARAQPGCRTLVLTLSSNPVLFARAIEAGASGVLHKSASLAEIVGAIRYLATGHRGKVRAKDTPCLK
jgi:DNA-binding NarL/FixJ family response regulator